MGQCYVSYVRLKVNWVSLGIGGCAFAWTMFDNGVQVANGGTVFGGTQNVWAERVFQINATGDELRLQMAHQNTFPAGSKHVRIDNIEINP
jgi:hypothetical protein